MYPHHFEKGDRAPLLSSLLLFPLFDLFSLLLLSPNELFPLLSLPPFLPCLPECHERLKSHAVLLAALAVSALGVALPPCGLVFAVTSDGASPAQIGRKLLAVVDHGRRRDDLERSPYLRRSSNPRLAQRPCLRPRQQQALCHRLGRLQPVLCRHLWYLQATWASEPPTPTFTMARTAYPLPRTDDLYKATFLADGTIGTITLGTPGSTHPPRRLAGASVTLPSTQPAASTTCTGARDPLPRS
jgi:hypothetical protein